MRPPSRRQILALGAAVAAAGALGIGTTAWSWWDAPADLPYTAMATEEGAFIVAMGEALYPPGGVPALAGVDAALDRFFDDLLLTMPDFQSHGLRMLLRALDRSTLLTEGSRFAELPVDTRDAVIKGWMVHPLAEIRSAATSLIVLIGMGYTTHPKASPLFASWMRCGYGL